MGASFYPENYPELKMTAVVALSLLVPVLLLVSVLLHELSHSVVSISQGIPVKKITLFIFGGMAQMDEEPDDPDKELKIALAGPLMSVFLLFVFYMLTRLLLNLGVPEAYTIPISYAATLNAMIVIFNMVPAFPMDGGRVLRAIIWKYKKDLQYATRITSSMGSTFGYMLMFMGGYWIFTGYLLNGIWFLFIGWFIRQLSESGMQNTMMTDLFKKIKVKEFMTESPISVEAGMSVQHLVDQYFYKYKFHCFPVNKEGKTIGIAALEHVHDIPLEERSQTPVSSIALAIDKPYIVGDTDIMTTAMDKIFNNGLGRVLVIEEEKTIGIITRSDILHYIRIYNKLHE